MQQTKGALTEKAILEMPFVRYMSYIESISKQHETQEDMDYFNGSQKLANEWKKNKDKWLNKKRVM